MQRREGLSVGESPASQDAGMQKFVKMNKIHDRIEQHFDDRDKKLDRHFERMGQHSNDIMQEHGSDCRFKALPEEQARPEYEDLYNKESGEPDNTFTADGEEGVTSAENQLEKQPNCLDL